MAVRNSNINPSRKRVLMLLLAGSICVSGGSVHGKENASVLTLLPPAKLVSEPEPEAQQPLRFVPVQKPAQSQTQLSTPGQRPVSAQTAAGPLTQFRIARRPLFGGSKKSDLKFRKPGEKLPLSKNIPKPPGMVPEVKESYARPQKQTTPPSRAEVAAKPKSNPTARTNTATKPQSARQPQPGANLQQQATNVLRQHQQTMKPQTRQQPAPAGGGWVARNAIKQHQPLRDPSKKQSIKPQTQSIKPSSPPARKTSSVPPSTTQQVPPTKTLKRVVPEATVPGSKVPAIDLLPKKRGDLESNQAIDAIENVQPESASPALTGPAISEPAINEPGRSFNPTDDVSASIDLELNPADSEHTAEPTANDTSQLQPGQTSTDDLERRRPSFDDAQTQREPIGQDVRIEQNNRDSKPSFIGSNPWTTDLDYTGRPTEGVKVSGRVGRMKPGIQRVLQYFYDRPEIADKRSNWGMMHSIMVYGVDTRIVAGRKSYSAIGWIAGNNICRGKRLLIEDENGLNADSGIGLQGHQGQLLAVLSLCDVPADYPLYANDTKYSVAELIKTEMRACKSGEELTFTLIGLAHYLDTDATWVATDGQRWDFERLIREELAQPIVGAACGGTHRLMGFAHALRKRRAEGRPISGQWARAHKFTQDFLNYTYQLQNRDGSMSTRWFEGREFEDDTDRKIQTTGHMVEWLLTMTPDSQLQNPRLVAAIQYLMSAMHRDLDHDWAIGPKGHALRSLAMYYDRVYNSGTAWRTRGIASSGSNHQR